MRSSLDNQRDLYENDNLCLGAVTLIGGRKEQQDCFGYMDRRNETVIVLCDGMGGYSGGKQASQLAVNVILEQLEHCSAAVTTEEMQDVLKQASESIYGLKDAEGRPLHAGSTAVIVLVRSQKLYWASAGDSRAYLARDGEIVQLTIDHNYRTVLREQLEAGKISYEEYEVEKKNADALVSYLGIPKLPLIDYNNYPIDLMQGDVIVIVSDGVYRAVTERELLERIRRNQTPNEMLSFIESKIASRVSRIGDKCDNATAILIKMKEGTGEKHE